MKYFLLEVQAGINGIEHFTTILKELDLEQDLLLVGASFSLSYLPQDHFCLGTSSTFLCPAPLTQDSGYK